MMEGSKKQYGLIIPSKIKAATLNFRSRSLNPLLGSDEELEKDDEEQENALDWIAQSMKKSAGNSGMQSLQKRRIKEAFQDDPTIFQYDEVYDQIKESSQDVKKKQVTKKPKYIDTILKHTEKRKLESERRQERKVQKEREAEGEQFADKESFVTSSYLKKLEEIKQAEEAERKEKYMEEMVDVHKHKNFGVFYNHILNQRVGECVQKEEIEVKQETPEDNEVERPDENEVEKPDDTSFHARRKEESKNKIYRSRRDESESPERNRPSPKKKKKKRSTSYSSGNESPPPRKEKREKKKCEETTNTKDEKERALKVKVEKKIAVKDLPVEERIAKYEVTFAKRTTGQVFTDALRMYFERKAAKYEAAAGV